MFFRLSFLSQFNNFCIVSIIFFAFFLKTILCLLDSNDRSFEWYSDSNIYQILFLFCFVWMCVRKLRFAICFVFCFQKFGFLNLWKFFKILTCITVTWIARATITRTWWWWIARTWTWWIVVTRWWYCL